MSEMREFPESFQLDPQGRDVTPMPQIMEGLTPDVIALIRAEQASRKPRLVAGRPWWISAFSQQELKNAGLL